MTASYASDADRIQIAGGAPSAKLSSSSAPSLILMASRKGIEPLTPGLGNLCSILLSYRDKRHVRRPPSADGAPDRR